MIHALRNAFRLGRRLFAGHAGATACEYAFLLSVFAVVAISGAAMVGLKFTDMTSWVASGLSHGLDDESFGPGTTRSHTSFAGS